MKRFVFILFLIPLSLIAQKEIYINIQTYDNHGKVLPNSEIQLLIEGDTNVIILKTDRLGSVTTKIKADTDLVMLMGYNKDYYTQKRKLKQLYLVDNLDTLYTSLTFQPMVSILHGFTDLNLNSTYAVGNIVEFKDTIKIYTEFDQLHERQNYTKLTRINKITYEIEHWIMENGGLVDPGLHEDKLKIKLKKYDLVILKFGSEKKTYSLRGLKTKDGICYELINN